MSDNAADPGTPTHARSAGSVHISRRTALAAGAGTLLAAAGVAAFESMTSPAAADTTSSTTCSTATYTPEVTEGPYWVDAQLNRSDITTNSDGTNQQSGIALTPDLTFVDSSCAPTTGAYIDIWHCNDAASTPTSRPRAPPPRPGFAATR